MAPVFFEIKTLTRIIRPPHPEPGRVETYKLEHRISSCPNYVLCPSPISSVEPTEMLLAYLRCFGPTFFEVVFWPNILLHVKITRLKNLLVDVKIRQALNQLTS